MGRITALLGRNKLPLGRVEWCMRLVARGRDTGRIIPGELVAKWPDIGFAATNKSSDVLGGVV